MKYLTSLLPAFDQFKSRNVTIALLLVSTLVFALRISNIPVPLERDEGLHAYIAQRFSYGELPFRDIFPEKPPMISVMYFIAFKLFGENALAPHIFMNVYSLLTAFFIYLLARDMFSKQSGVFSAVSFLIISMGTSILGQSANSEIFAILPVTMGFYFSYVGIKNDKMLPLLFAGISFGVSILFKEPALLYWALPLATLILLYFCKKIHFKQIIIFISSWTIPLILFYIWLIYTNSLAGFKEYCVYYKAYSTNTPLFPLYPILRSLSARLYPIIKECPVFLILAWYGFHILFNAQKDNQVDSPYQTSKTLNFYNRHGDVIYLAGWLLASAIIISTGFRFYPHYFIFGTPPIAILAGIGFSALAKKIAGNTNYLAQIVLSILLVLLLLSPFLISNAYWRSSPTEKSRILYSSFNPFPEAQLIADYLKKNSNKNDKIYIAGSEAEILFLANRQSASQYVHIYALTYPDPGNFERQKFVAQEIVKQKPKYIIVIDSPTSILLNKKSSRFIFDFLNTLLHKSYTLEGLISLNRIYEQDKIILSADNNSKRSLEKNHNEFGLRGTPYIGLYKLAK